MPFEENLLHLEFDYVNHEGKASRRRVRPITTFQGETRWYEGEHLYLQAFDLDRQEERSFRLDRMENLAEVGSERLEFVANRGAPAGAPAASMPGLEKCSCGGRLLRFPASGPKRQFRCDRCGTFYGE